MLASQDWFGSVDTYYEFARTLVVLALGTYVAAVLLGLHGQVARDRRTVLAARRALYAGAVLVLGASAGLVATFFKGEYHLDYVFSYSERGLPTFFKFAGLWAGLNGSLLFWSMLLGLLAAFVASGFRREDPGLRRLEPTVLVVFAVVQAFFLLIIAFVANPFWELREVMDPTVFARRFPHGPAGITDGGGLNPLLVNYWMIFHPPSLYLGWVTYTVPFAFAIAALVTGELGNAWIRKVRVWTLIGWLFNTVGVVLGGLWAYRVLGWGGYWAWDPVENASFWPWCTATALLHSIIVQERRQMLRVWNVALVCATFLLSIYGTYLTRSGIVNSVHAFASGEVGNYFFGFWLACVCACTLLIAWRASRLRGHASIQSLLSREAVFVLNNAVLLMIAGSTIVLTHWPKWSEEWFSQATTVGPKVYNLVTVPLFVLLLLFTALGPGLGWVRTSLKTLRRNFLLPALLALPAAAALQWLIHTVRGATDDPLPLGLHFYPGGLINVLSLFIVFSLGAEVLRTARYRARHRDQSMVAALVALATGNNRRYGGYLAHVGIATIAMGIVASGVFNEKRELRIGVGETVEMGDYALRLDGVELDQQSYVYHQERLRLELFRHGKSVTTLLPERRLYPENQFRRSPQTTTEVQIHARALEDFYVYYQSAESGEDGSPRYVLTVFRNPLIQLIPLGLVILVAGGLWAAMPMGRRRRVGLSD